jgi:hypothetical protein
MQAPVTIDVERGVGHGDWSVGQNWHMGASGSDAA